MAHLEKQAVIDAVTARLKSDTTVNSWAGMIASIDADPTPHEIGQARTRGNYMYVRDGGMQPEQKSTAARIQAMFIDIAICAGMKQTRLRDGAGRTVLGIEDDVRRVLTDATSIYAATGISIMEAEIVNSPPTATVWGALFEESEASGYRMAVVQLKLRIYERR
jgi:hypothetical protein